MAAATDRYLGRPRRPFSAAIEIGAQRCAASRAGSRRRTSPAPHPPAPGPRPASAIIPPADGTRIGALVDRGGPLPLVPASTVRSARGTVEIGFIATRTRTGSPFVMPPLMPPARFDSRVHPRPSPRGRGQETLRDCPVWRPAPARPRSAASRRGRRYPADECGAETVTDLHPLHRLDAHQRPRQPRVEAAVGLYVGAEPDRQAVGDHLDHAAERVGLVVRGVDLGHHRRGRRRGERAHRAGIHPLQVARTRHRVVVRGVDRPIATTRDTISTPRACVRNAFATVPSTPATRSPRAGPLEDRPGVVEPELRHPGQVGVARPGTGQRRVAGAVGDQLGVDGSPPSPSPTSATRSCRSAPRPARPASCRGGSRRSPRARRPRTPSAGCGRARACAGPTRPSAPSW